MSTFVLEIGSEEIPARFLKEEERLLRGNLARLLEEQALQHGTIRTLSTPRRLAVLVDEIKDKQDEKTEIITGPPLRIAYDAEGRPTKALEGFLRTQNVKPEEIFQTETAKGVYLAVRKTSGGLSALDVLAALCPQLITALTFPKSMHWGSSKLLYARPLHWLLALLDAQVVPFSLEQLTSDRLTYGHRVHGAGPFSVATASEYEQILADKGHVILNSAQRREMIVHTGDALAYNIQAQILWNEATLSEVIGLVESPEPLLGNFDPSYLEVPREVLLTSMEKHLKSFGVVDADGQLTAHFLTVLNLHPKDLAPVQKGWERVLRARLEDARFFWHSDLRESFDLWLNKLDSVIFIGALGTMGDKTRRLEQLCAWLAERCLPDQPALREDAARAGRLSKADLVTGLVGEFDTLQGIMGGIYAEHKHEKQNVADALKEQYLPAGPDSPLPTTVLGALLSLADKADTLMGCFGLNKIPTGVADPNGLRRCALGIVRILLHFAFPVQIRDFLAYALELYGEKNWVLPPETALDKSLDFFVGRLQQYLRTQNYDALLTDAVLRAGLTDLPDLLARIQALTEFKASPDYATSVSTFKRAGNIVRKQGKTEQIPDKWDVNLLADPADKKFAETLDSTLPLLQKYLQQHEYAQVLQALQTLRPAVDNFFNSVMVICEDPNLRQNRLSMLNNLAGLFLKMADFTVLPS